jgi:Flp pilus assembly pilin Flp
MNDPDHTSTDPSPTSSGEDGSLVTEYGLLAVVAATVAGVLIQWATGGAVVNLFNALVDRARDLVGA